MPTLSSRLKRQTYTTVAGPPDDGMPSMTITTAATDREQDEVVPEGIDLRAYRRNPVVLFGHDHRSLPVGVATSLDVSPGEGIRATWRWLEGDPFADRVRNAYDQGVLRAASIGFSVKEYERNDHGGLRYTQTELLEFSLVPVPANDQAVRSVLRSLGLDGPPTVANASALIASLDTQLREGRTLSRGAERRVAAALATLRGVVRATDDDADDHDDEHVVTLEEPEALAVVFGEDGSVTDVDRDALRAAVDAVVEAEFAYATGRIPEGKTLLTRGKGDAVIDMDPDELLELIRTGLGAAIDQKLKYVTGRVD
jgi:HK97 family phage prohead protease